jgi:hypothetical protein
MAEDHEGAKHLEADLKKRAGRRERWLARQWRVSSRGNDWLNVHEHHVVVFKNREGRWTFAIDECFADRDFDTEESAKLAAFDALWPPARYGHMSSTGSTE